MLHYKILLNLHFVFLDDRNKLKMFKTADWINVKSLPVRLEDGFLAVVNKPGVYLVYAQVIIFIVPFTITITIVSLDRCRQTRVS